LLQLERDLWFFVAKDMFAAQHNESVTYELLNWNSYICLMFPRDGQAVETVNAIIRDWPQVLPLVSIMRANGRLMFITVSHIATSILSLRQEAGVFRQVLTQVKETLAGQQTALNQVQETLAEQQHQSEQRFIETRNLLQNLMDALHQQQVPQQNAPPRLQRQPQLRGSRIPRPVRRQR
jgi:hypothetical protein